MRQFKLIPPPEGVGFRGHGAWVRFLCPRLLNGEASIHHRLTSVGIPRRFL